MRITDAELSNSGLRRIDDCGDYTIAYDAYFGRYCVPGECADGYYRPIGDTYKRIDDARSLALSLTERNRKDNLNV